MWAGGEEFTACVVPTTTMQALAESWTKMAEGCHDKAMGRGERPSVVTLLKFFLIQERLFLHLQRSHAARSRCRELPHRQGLRMCSQMEERKPLATPSPTTERKGSAETAPGSTGSRWAQRHPRKACRPAWNTQASSDRAGQDFMAPCSALPG